MAAPSRGDLVWLDFDPQAGHEQAGRRPALVISPRSYHQKTKFVVVCPITNTIKGYPFEVVLPDDSPIRGAVLSDQIKSLDRHSRRIEFAGKASDWVVAEVIAKALTLFEMP